MPYRRELPEIPHEDKLLLLTEVPVFAFYFPDGRRAGWYRRDATLKTYSGLSRIRVRSEWRDVISCSDYPLISVLSNGFRMDCYFERSGKLGTGTYWLPIKWWHGCGFGLLAWIAGCRWTLIPEGQ